MVVATYKNGSAYKRVVHLNPSIHPVIQPDRHFIHPDIRLFKTRSMPITEVRHESVKPVRKGEVMIITHLCLRHGAHTSILLSPLGLKLEAFKSHICVTSP